MARFIPCARAKYPRLPQIASSGDGAIAGAREKDINRAPSAPRKQSAQASKLCFIAFANTPCAMRRGTASHLAAGHTAAAVSCRLARRHEAVLQPLRTRAVPPKPLAYSAARCSGASRGRQTAWGSSLPKHFGEDAPVAHTRPTALRSRSLTTCLFPQARKQKSRY